MANVEKTASDQESIENIFLRQFLESIAAGSAANPYVTKNIPDGDARDYVELTCSDQKTVIAAPSSHERQFWRFGLKETRSLYFPKILIPALANPGQDSLSQSTLAKMGRRQSFFRFNDSWDSNWDQNAQEAGWEKLKTELSVIGSSQTQFEDLKTYCLCQHIPYEFFEIQIPVMKSRRPKNESERTVLSENEILMNFKFQALLYHSLQAGWGRQTDSRELQADPTGNIAKATGIEAWLLTRLIDGRLGIEAMPEGSNNIMEYSASNNVILFRENLSPLDLTNLSDMKNAWHEMIHAYWDCRFVPSSRQASKSVPRSSEEFSAEFLAMYIMTQTVPGFTPTQLENEMIAPTDSSMRTPEYLDFRQYRDGGVLHIEATANFDMETFLAVIANPNASPEQMQMLMHKAQASFLCSYNAYIFWNNIFESEPIYPEQHYIDSLQRLTQVNTNDQEELVRTVLRIYTSKEERANERVARAYGLLCGLINFYFVEAVRNDDAQTKEKCLNKAKNLYGLVVESILPIVPVLDLIGAGRYSIVHDGVDF